MARGSKIIIMTDERIKDKLSHYADLYGMTVSALGAYILGHWVNQQEKVEPFFQEFRKFSEHLAEMIWDDATKRLE